LVRLDDLDALRGLEEGHQTRPAPLRASASRR
jgi:hypothetical protein